DAGFYQLERMAAVEGPRHHLHQGKFRVDQLGDPGRFVFFVDGDDDDVDLFDARSAQDVEPCAVAIIDLGAELRGGADHVGVGVDQRNLVALGERRLRRDLPEAPEADDEDIAGQAV